MYLGEEETTADIVGHESLLEVRGERNRWETQGEEGEEAGANKPAPGLRVWLRTAIMFRNIIRRQVKIVEPVYAVQSSRQGL